MTALHGWLAAVVAATTLAALASAALLRIGHAGARLWVDRAILAALGMIAVDGALGLALVASGHAPTDLLHVVYGAVALVLLPIARWGGRSPDLRRRALWLAGGSVVLLGVLVRLAQTG